MLNLLNRYKILMAGLMVWGLVPVVAEASLVTVTSYSMQNGSDGVNGFFYGDATYSNCPGGDCTTVGTALSGGVGRLTNGVLPTTDWNVNSNSADWLGWSNGQANGSNPTITFNFNGSATINAISVVFDNSQGFGNVFAPASISINGTNYTVAASSTEGPQTLTISGLDLTGDSDTLQFFQGGAGVQPSWVMIGQVSFFGGSTTPEPGTNLLLGAGFLAVTVAEQRRRIKLGRKDR